MDINQKQFLDIFTKQDNEFTDSFVLAVDKLNEIFVEIFNFINERLNGQVDFNLNLIGEHYLGTNYGFDNPTHIMIEYNVREEDLQFSEKRAKKGNIGKLYTDAFNRTNNLVLTIPELAKFAYNELSLKLKNASVFIRKNQISIKFLDFKFFIFFVCKNQSILENETEFLIKGKHYNYNFSLMHNNLLQKNKETNGSFFSLIKFYKIIELELALNNKLLINNSKTPYFYENLLYNVPNYLMNNEFVYDNFLQSKTYLLNANLKELISSDEMPLIDDNFKIHSKPNITSLDINKTFKQVNIFIDNVNNFLNFENEQQLDNNVDNETSNED